VDSNGNEVPKLFLVVGAHADKNYLTLKSTSKKRWREYQPEDGYAYYFIPGGKKEWFEFDTWILFSEPQEFNRVGAQREIANGKMRVMTCLRFQLTNEICNKMRKCDDVSEYYCSLLGPALGAQPA
jgi:hypothetical protein